jgi:hypothetical protein
MNLIEQIKEKTGIDVTNKCRERENVYAKAIYSKIMHDEYGYGTSKIAKLLKLAQHGTVINQIDSIFPEAINNSKFHRKLYYELLGIEDPRESPDAIVSKKLIEEIMQDYKFFIKPHHKRQLDKLLNK